MIPDFDTLQHNFALLDGWEERYAYLLDLGKKLPTFNPEWQIEDHFVRGCTAQVWLVPQTSATNGNISFLADSDAHLVRGLIAILMSVYNNQPKEFVTSFDVEIYFNQLGLAQHLSPNRRNGFFAMVGRIKALAQ